MIELALNLSIQAEVTAIYVSPEEDDETELEMGRGLLLRWTPAGRVMGALPEGSAVMILYERSTSEGLAWVKVTDAEGRVGWVAEDYLITRQATATPGN